MEIETARKILREIESHGKNGVGVSSIASSTDISHSEIREFLSEHPDMVIKSSTKPTYTISRYGPHKGSVDNMLASMAKNKKANHLFWYFFVILISFNLGLMIGNAN
jgi:hypothetical protein